ncbi:MAG: ribbon-helix-helix domain-containing protein [Blastomonas fulva]|jgi:predicted DNA-binding ribbon-helix-helix protein|uniref:ribbon-helix-helix domain-containing protein n=1 Tax=Blastomonas fulva TaxID=1550728 RepID=UPI004033AAA2
MISTDDLYRGPVKRSIQIAGHLTSISLEPLFWDMLKAAAETRALPLNALVARIDVERIEADDPPNLASAIRLWLVRDLVETLSTPAGGRGG